MLDAAQVDAAELRGRASALEVALEALNDAAHILLVLQTLHVLGRVGVATLGKRRPTVRAHSEGERGGRLCQRTAAERRAR